MELRILLLVLSLLTCSSQGVLDYVPPIGMIKAEVMRLAGESDSKVDDVLKKSSYLAHTIAKVLQSGVNVMDGDMIAAKRYLKSISTYVEKKHVDELRAIPNGIPVVGHAIAGVQAYNGHTESARRTMETVNSGLGSALGGAIGLLCGPAAVACVPLGSLIGKTTVDGAYSLVDRDGKLHGNVDYLANFRKKDVGEHFDFFVGTALDAIGGKLASNKVKKKVYGRRRLGPLRRRPRK